MGDVRRWVEGTQAGRDAETSTATATADQGQGDSGLPKEWKASTPLALCRVVVRAVKMLTYSYALLALVSFWVDRREALGPRDLPVELACVLLLSWLVIRLTAQPIEPRFFLVLVLLALPRVARGAILASQAAARWLRPRCSISISPDVLLAGLMLVLVIHGTVAGRRAAERDAEHRNEQAALGRWILAEFGPGQRILANLYGYQLLVYHAEGIDVAMPLDVRRDGNAFGKAIRDKRPDVVVVWKNGDLGRSRESCGAVLREQGKLGYRVVGPDPPRWQTDEVVVLRADDRR
jgi:hypothetical protein